ncbi:zinc finger CCHC domain-containing protein 10-like [Adelges cooleyi]|uniref:zinc finger CCHC domain-containing protein 10-like n=1 Tax=Adelges cooleyi TaxID=133065 RepID=UPI00217FD801|nr:zinc finger CCHC domain-containing protein 10-like [Adelges cooleyi]XP_050443079.1 zinc finger CCHC domain-containing protein 10-like [Adelges cooleyi]XP_050443080.1 zinc finger CCHC domain-containing protein 10-like [Adelges cooleyi]XP_050443081.1 zinc finger CCHC domain-containing protein 10-like [Adelges cooleyi]
MPMPIINKKKLSYIPPQGVRCQKCLEHGHWTYECKGKRKFADRPSRTTLLKRNLNKDRPAKAVLDNVPKKQTGRAKRKKKTNSSDSSSSSSDSDSSESSSSSSTSSSSNSSTSSSSSSSSSSSDHSK